MMKEYTLEASVIIAALIVASAILSITPTMPVDFCEGCTVIKGATVTTTGNLEHGIAVAYNGSTPTVTYPRPPWARLDDVVRYAEDINGREEE